LEISLTDEYINQTLVDKAKEVADLQVTFNKQFSNTDDLIECLRQWNIVFSYSLREFNVVVDNEESDYEEE